MDIWTYLQIESKKGRPILMYGMGNGGDKVIGYCEMKGIHISDTFASDGFVRGQTFHGRRVLSFSEALSVYGDSMIVLLAFATSRPDVIENIQRIASMCELYVPDVPVFGDTLFDEDFYLSHKDEIEEFRSHLADERSREILDSVINYKLSARLEPLFESRSDMREIYENVLDTKGIRCAVDLGAYVGDSAKEMISHFPTLEKIIAFEPDPKTYKKLVSFSDMSPVKIYPYNACAWRDDMELTFCSEGNRNSSPLSSVAKLSGSVGKMYTVRALAPDNIAELQNNRVDYIKYDVEGSEYEAILGSREIIARDKPKLLVSLYHRSEDIFTLPKLIRTLRQDYSFYLRRPGGIPAWDLNLYCI